MHESELPLIICNVWDVPSAQIARRLGFRAIGTSSAAIAAMLGYRDGEEISFEEVFYIVQRIRSAVDLPLTVDIEAGYGATADQVARNIILLNDLGVCGVNIEDSYCNPGRTLLGVDVFAGKLAEICKILAESECEIFVNVRTDTFLLGLENALEETIIRGNRYREAGADGIFVPCITSNNDISEVVSQLSLPLNVMCTPRMPNFEVLGGLGVKRISMGNYAFDKVGQLLDEELSTILTDNSFEKLIAQ